MSVNNSSVVRQSVFTTVTCGVAVMIALLMLYALVNFPQESNIFLTKVGVFLAAVYEPNAAILHPLLLPGYDLLFWLIGLPMAALCVSFPLYVWCYCVAHNLRVKYISNRYTAAISTARTYIGYFVCFLLYLKVVPLLSEMGGLTFFVGLSLALIIKSITERDWYDQFDERQLLKTQVQPEAAEVV